LQVSPQGFQAWTDNLYVSKTTTNKGKTVDLILLAAMVAAGHIDADVAAEIEAEAS